MEWTIRTWQYLRKRRFFIDLGMVPGCGWTCNTICMCVDITYRAYREVIGIRAIGTVRDSIFLVLGRDSTSSLQDGISVRACALLVDWHLSAQHEEDGWGPTVIYVRYNTTYTTTRHTAIHYALPPSFDFFSSCVRRSRFASRFRDFKLRASRLRSPAFAL